MGMDAHNTDHKTYKHLVQVNGWPESAVRAYISRKYEGARLTDMCSPENAQHLSERYGSKPAQKPVQKSNVAWPTELIEGAKIPLREDKVLNAVEIDEDTDERTLNISDLLLVFIVVAEMLLALIGSFVQFSFGGLLIGLVLVAFYANTGWQMWKGDKQFAQDYGMFICAIITCVFMWGGGQTFWVWYSGDPSLQVYVCNISAALFSIVSYSSMFQLKNTRA